MQRVGIIGLDLAKRVFQAHGAHADGSVSFRKKLSRERLLAFLKEQPRCFVAMEACGSAHHSGRAIRDLGHEARLIPPIYVKPFVKRQKNDSAKRLRRQLSDRPCVSFRSRRPRALFVYEELQWRSDTYRSEHGCVGIASCSGRRAHSLETNSRRMRYQYVRI
jgi:hypothetical protein